VEEYLQFFLSFVYVGIAVGDPVTGNKRAGFGSY